MTDKKRLNELFPMGNSGLVGKIISFFLGRKRR